MKRPAQVLEAGSSVVSDLEHGLEGQRWAGRACSFDRVDSSLHGEHALEGPQWGPLELTAQGRGPLAWV